MIELQDYLDKYEDKIKFMTVCSSAIPGYGAGMVMLIIDES